MNFYADLTLLSKDEIFGGYIDRQLDVLKNYGARCAITDLGILTGGFFDDSCENMVPDDNSLKGRTGNYHTKSSGVTQTFSYVTSRGSFNSVGTPGFSNFGVIRPVLRSTSIFLQVSPNRSRLFDGTGIVEFGEYPQYAANSDMQSKLENEYQRGLLKTTGKDYTFNKTGIDDEHHPFVPVKYEEYEYDGKKYIRIKSECRGKEGVQLSNGEYYQNGDYVWVEVSPVEWLIDDETRTLVSKKVFIIRYKV